MNRRAFATCLAASMAALAFKPAEALADMPWSRYLAMREAAPEVLQVTVITVAEATRDGARTIGPYQHRRRITEVAARLKVDAVRRTATRLAAGDVIELRYQIVLNDTGFPAAWPPRLLKPNERL
ncbi:MAG: hypothetical protein IT538_11630, partial [Variibacter sp.]|nr:hypothetical protein [Variibacter sp.]